jgi:hypothetical protein
MDHQSLVNLACGNDRRQPHNARSRATPGTQAKVFLILKQTPGVTLRMNQPVVAMHNSRS